MTRALALLTPNRRRHPKLTKPHHPKAHIATADGIKLILPFAPNEVTHEGLADNWGTVDRPGRKPLVTFTAEGLRAMSFTVLLGHRDHQVDVEDMLHKLARIAAARSRVTVKLSAFERGSWRMTSATVNTILRQYGTNAVTRATVDLAFLEAVGVNSHTGPLAGGHKKDHHHGRSPKFYRVKANDNAAGIAAKTLGDPTRWPEILDLNGIDDPRRLVIGSRLRIPH